MKHVKIMKLENSIVKHESVIYECIFCLLANNLSALISNKYLKDY